MIGPRWLIDFAVRTSDIVVQSSYLPVVAPCTVWREQGLEA